MGAMKRLLEDRQTQISALLDDLELYGFECVAGPLENSEPWNKLRDIAKDFDSMLDGVEPSTGALTKDHYRYVSVISNAEGGRPIVVAWDICGKCSTHVRHCNCSAGPSEPGYMEAWRNEGRVGLLGMEWATTPVPSPENAKSVSNQIAKSDSGTGAIPQVPGQVTVEEAIAEGAEKCRECKTPITSDYPGDENDDGTLTCYPCQEASI